VNGIWGGFQGEGSKTIILTVFKNPQSILCGLIAGFLFIPTTIFDMIWGVRYLQEAHGFSYASAVMRSATVPLGWIIGCPLLGFISDRIGRRKPVIIGGAVVLLPGTGVDSLWPSQRISAIYDWSVDRDCLRGGNVAVRRNQGG
jgi:sugar phosphate permease